MRCGKVKNLIPELVADEVPSPTKTAALHHVLTCRECRLELEAYRVAISALKAARVPNEPVGQYAWPDIKVAAMPRRDARVHSRGVLFAAACSTVALLMLVVLPFLASRNVRESGKPGPRLVAKLPEGPVVVSGQVQALWELVPQAQPISYPHSAPSIASAERGSPRVEPYASVWALREYLPSTASEFLAMPVAAVAAYRGREDF